MEEGADKQEKAGAEVIEDFADENSTKQHEEN